MALPTVTPSVFTGFTLNFSAELTYYNRRIAITDTTDIYSVTNPTGWGTPNPDIADATAVAISVLDPGGTTWYIDSSGSNDPFPTLPNITDTAFEILNTDIGLGATDEITDGIYYITYNVSGTTTGTDWVKQITYPFLFTAQADCCVEQLFSDVDPNDCCSCEKSKLQTAIEARGYLVAAQYAARCIQVDRAQTFIDKLTFICNASNCNC